MPHRQVATGSSGQRLNKVSNSEHSFPRPVVLIRLRSEERAHFLSKDLARNGDCEA